DLLHTVERWDRAMANRKEPGNKGIKARQELKSPEIKKLLKRFKQCALGKMAQEKLPEDFVLQSITLEGLKDSEFDPEHVSLSHPDQNLYTVLESKGVINETWVEFVMRLRDDRSTLREMYIHHILIGLITYLSNRTLAFNQPATQSNWILSP